MYREFFRRVVTAANTEESLVLPNNVRRIQAVPLSTPHAMVFALANDLVLEGGGFGATEQQSWDSGYLEASTYTLYWAAPLSGMVFLVTLWLE